MKIPRNKKTRNPRIEIIPMIDVMFFLLATMLMASLSLQKLNGIKVDLTQGSGEVVNDLDKLITINISHDNLVYINKDLVAINNIANYLKKFSSEEISNIIISADSSANHGTVTMAMSNAKIAGAKKFSIITKK